jgi:polar amino acid transport system permease protein
MGFVTVFSFWRVLLTGLETTLYLTIIAIGGGTLVGLLVGLLVTRKSRVLRLPLRLYLSVFRGTPLLIQLFMIYLGPGYFGIQLPLFEAAAIGFTLYSGAYIAEMVRSGIEAVPVGQVEAAYSLGMSYLQVTRRVVLPPAFKMITPALASWYLSLVKDTSIASIIGLSEIVGQSQIVIAATVKPFQVYAVVAAAYFVICFPISLGVSRLERRSRPEKRGLVT